jgi:hypothetical protein
MKAKKVVEKAIKLGLIRYNDGESFSPFYGAARHDVWFSCGAGVNKTIDANDVEQYTGLKIVSINGDSIEKLV